MLLDLLAKLQRQHQQEEQQVQAQLASSTACNSSDSGAGGDSSQGSGCSSTSCMMHGSHAGSSGSAGSSASAGSAGTDFLPNNNACLLGGEDKTDGPLQCRARSDGSSKQSCVHVLSNHCSAGQAGMPSSTAAGQVWPGGGVYCYAMQGNAASVALMESVGLVKYGECWWMCFEKT